MSLDPTTLRVIIEVVIFLITFGGAVLKINAILSSIKTELVLLRERFDGNKSMLSDHEDRLRVLEAHTQSCPVALKNIKRGE